MSLFALTLYWVRLFLLLSPLTTSRTAATDVSDEAILDPAGVMMYYGNDVEVHRVVTTDGFILEVDRLLPRSSNDTAPKRTPMLLVHGLLVNSVSWVSNLPSQSPGFLLADAGYDVWLMNTRGVPQSNYHVTLSTNDPAFWKWSFEEIGMYDLPATVDYILNETGFSKLGLLAASQGGTAVLVFLSMLPEYNDKVNIFVAYAPVANLTHFASPMRLFIPLAEPLTMINDFFTHGGLLVSNPIKQRLIALACDTPLRDVCYLPYAIIFGINPKQHNSTRVPVYIANFPSGISSQAAVHYAQVWRAKNFVRFDYGILENLFRYGQVKPPAYPLEKIRAPVAIYQGLGDNFAVPQDLDDLSVRLKDVLVFKHVVADPDFGHLDFLSGWNATDILHSHMIDLISRYTTVGA